MAPVAKDRLKPRVHRLPQTLVMDPSVIGDELRILRVPGDADPLLLRCPDEIEVPLHLLQIFIFPKDPFRKLLHKGPEHLLCLLLRVLSGSHLYPKLRFLILPQKSRDGKPVFPFSASVALPGQKPRVAPTAVIQEIEAPEHGSSKKAEDLIFPKPELPKLKLHPSAASFPFRPGSPPGPVPWLQPDVHDPLRKETGRQVYQQADRHDKPPCRGAIHYLKEAAAGEIDV